MARTRVLSVASEVYPIVKTGGLADVVGALPNALARHDIDVSTLIPGYRAVMSALPAATTVLTLADCFGGEARILAGSAGGLDLLVLDAPHLFDRLGGPYTDSAGVDWSDNAFRFAALASVGAQIGLGAIERYRPDVIHVHDWQAGLLPAYLRYSGERGPGTVMTVHNLAFAGRFDPSVLPDLGLPAEAYTFEGLEFYDSISYLKAGLVYADWVTTVSPTYAQEIATPEGGMGLDGVLRGRAQTFSGILNGIDAEVWDPASDAYIAARFDVDSLALRAANTAALRRRFALDDDPAALIVGIVSRLSWQKGLDVLLDALPRLIARGIQFVVLGSGEATLETGFVEAVAAYPGRIGVYIGYDETAAHLVQAGAGVVLVPSRFEPCGLTQLCALRYGAIPVVARVGGLADTVIDANVVALSAGVATGIQFAAPPTSEALESAIVRAATLFAEPSAWRRMQHNAMTTDVSWNRSGHEYAQVYQSVLRARA